jgi:hypothetical protein
MSKSETPKLGEVALPDRFALGLVQRSNFAVVVWIQRPRFAHCHPCGWEANYLESEMHKLVVLSVPCSAEARSEVGKGAVVEVEKKTIVAFQARQQAWSRGKFE